MKIMWSTQEILIGEEVSAMWEFSSVLISFRWCVHTTFIITLRNNLLYGEKRESGTP